MSYLQGGLAINTSVTDTVEVFLVSLSLIMNEYTFQQILCILAIKIKFHF